MSDNGYSDSIIPCHSETECWRCGCNGRGKMDRHEVFGAAHRSKSKRYGLWVHLCHDECHLNGVHKHSCLANELKAEAQRCAMKTYGWTEEEFRQHFGKNYL